MNMILWGPSPLRRAQGTIVTTRRRGFVSVRPQAQRSLYASLRYAGCEGGFVRAALYYVFLRTPRCFWECPNCLGMGFRSSNYLGYTRRRAADLSGARIEALVRCRETWLLVQLDGHTMVVSKHTRMSLLSSVLAQHHETATAR